MSYTVLARRYRSQSFDQLVGQRAIVQTLRTAISADRVAHAYLFTGTRGVGKTSAARLFADALNNPAGDAQIRDAIMQGRDTDVIEIDAASNSKVDETRELIANAVYRPLRGRKKIYIIDECHMLSTAAFNALLKTMEEPPDHVVFVLCTTETHKVPATIQSRCQRFDFRTIGVSEIAAHLTQVIKGEGLEGDEELVHMVARLAHGSMRDALSLLDRLMASGQKRLTPELLEELLGLPDRTLIGEIVEACADGDAGEALRTAHQLLAKGVGLEQVLTGLAERFRDLMVILACGPATELVELSEEARQQAVAQAQKFDGASLSHMIALCEGASRAAKGSSFPRALGDALLVRLAMTEKVADAAAIIAAMRQQGAPIGEVRAAPAQVAHVTTGAPPKKR